MDLGLKVDAKLFSTCRLCVENMGAYQITLSVQEQMKYCFDIDVGQYDGLPQLICEPCGRILTDYYTKKRTFVGNQNALKARLQIRQEIETSRKSRSPQHDVVSTSGTSQLDEVNGRRTSRCASSSTSKTRRHSQSSSEANYTTNTQKKRQKSGFWESKYNKSVVCRLCDRQCRNRANIRRHLSVHKDLYSQYNDVLSKPCTVKLIKYDEKPNFTGDENTALSTDRLIRDEGTSAYHILYTLKDEFKTLDNNEEDESEGDPDSDDEFTVKRSTTKRRRLLSRDSNDTVVLGEQAEAQAEHDEDKTPEIECIDLDDSDSSDSKSELVSTKQSREKNDEEEKLRILIDERNIQTIVKAIQLKYMKQFEKEKEAISNRNKVFKMGLKTIFANSKAQLKCTPLLRYLEHENLDIKWKAFNNTSRTPTILKETQHVRIIPRLENKEDNCEEDMSGWKPVIKTKHVKNNTNDVKNSANVEASTQPCQSTVRVDTELLGLSETTTSRKEISLADGAVLYSNPHPDLDQKLLNANPVANPKQLPKKATPSDSKVSIIVSPVSQGAIIKSPVYLESATHPTKSAEICREAWANAFPAEDMCMPVITSTTSLAPGNQVSYTYDGSSANQDSNVTSNTNGVHEPDKTSEENPTSSDSVTAKIPTSSDSVTAKDTTSSDSVTAKDTTSSDTPKNPTPMIKVKPASALLSDRALSQQKAINSMQPVVTQPNVVAVEMAPSGISQVAQPKSGFWILPSDGVVQSPVISQVQSLSSQQTLPLVQKGPRPLTMTNGGSDCLVLDSVLMPNSRNLSPYQYVKNLLLCNNILLLDDVDQLNGEFFCLIKFKMQLSQQMVQHSVILCLTLLCSENKLFLGVTDPKNTRNSRIDLKDLPNNWQWEILKIFSAEKDVINKVYLNAQKVGHQTYLNAKTFVTVLKSIELKSAV